MKLQNKNGVATLDIFVIMVFAIGILLLSFYAIAFYNKMLYPADDFLIKTGGLLSFIGFIVLCFRFPVWIKANKEEKAKVDDVAKSINADKAYGNSYVNFIGSRDGIRYKVIYRKPQFKRVRSTLVIASSPSKLSIHIYLNRTEKLKLFMINKHNWGTQGILTVLMLRKLATGFSDTDSGYIVRTNDKKSAMRFLSSETKRKTLLSLCEKGFEIELNKKCLYLGREGVTYGADMMHEKDSIIDIISKASQLYKEFA